MMERETEGEKEDRSLLSAHLRQSRKRAERAGLPYPEAIENPEDIDCLVIVKLHHAQKKLERGFFTCAFYEEYKEKSEVLLDCKIKEGDM